MSVHKSQLVNTLEELMRLRRLTFKDLITYRDRFQDMDSKNLVSIHEALNHDDELIGIGLNFDVMGLSLFNVDTPNRSIDRRPLGVAYAFPPKGNREIIIVNTTHGFGQHTEVSLENFYRICIIMEKLLDKVLLTTAYGDVHRYLMNHTNTSSMLNDTTVLDILSNMSRLDYLYLDRPHGETVNVILLSHCPLENLHDYAVTKPYDIVNMERLFIYTRELKVSCKLLGGHLDNRCMFFNKGKLSIWNDLFTHAESCYRYRLCDLVPLKDAASFY